jgi:hypothetical protein
MGIALAARFHGRFYRLRPLLLHLELNRTRFAVRRIFGWIWIFDECTTTVSDPCAGVEAVDGVVYSTVDDVEKRNRSLKTERSGPRAERKRPKGR